MAGRRKPKTNASIQRAAMRNLCVPMFKRAPDNPWNEHGDPWLPSVWMLSADRTLSVNSHAHPGKLILLRRMLRYCATRKEALFMGRFTADWDGPHVSYIFKNTHKTRRILNQIIERARWRRVDGKNPEIESRRKRYV